ncbi:3-oxoacyl-ACP synthase III family protein [Curtanaerobium respiraculi]|uniref:3-oxoacyl-ACP synthase III family protein n=1 Tax=Curtanaerobium respiraculi TaxID=2949669 RepID=UPI0024B32140|nr:3-oxoacyl-[acyl-carrier-protein] synthase III C-terminal domain-containing protein [Curtanaerobium respiraculi]
MGASLIGCGKALPALRVRNDDLSSLVETDDEWIVKRTGIHERRIAVGETATDLASAACEAAMGIEPRVPQGMKTAGWHGHVASGECKGGQIDPATIDLVVCMTVSGDAAIPSQAALVKMRLGLSNAVAFDVNAACSGCVYGLSVAEGLMRAAAAAPGRCNPVRRALVVGVERLSRVVDWGDRSTCVLFGDGAGAVLLEWRDDRRGIISTFLKNTDDPDLTLSLGLPRPGEPPFDAEGVGKRGGAYRIPYGMTPYIGMAGREVFKFATAAVREAIEEAARRGETDLGDLACIVPHQANERIIAHVAKKMGLPLERFQLSIGECGNTSAASALIALCDAYSLGKIGQGDRVVIVGFGGGLTSGALLFEA